MIFMSLHCELVVEICELERNQHCIMVISKLYSHCVTFGLHLYMNLLYFFKVKSLNR